MREEFGRDCGTAGSTLATEIDASCSLAVPSSGGNSGGAVTRGVVGQTSTVSLSGNFIKLDEERNPLWTNPSDYLPMDRFSWSDSRTRIVDASIFSSPDNSEGFFFRSISFSPRQVYQYSTTAGYGETPSADNTVGYITRMVGWCPKTFDVPAGIDGTPADVAFTSSDSYVRVTKDGKDYDCVKFKNKLNGETDVMMSDMREGRMDLGGSNFKNNGNDRDVQPFGHQYNDYMSPSGGFRYCNYFSFNHYLTAIRLFVNAEGCNPSIVFWNHIKDVVFPDQPSTVTVALPDKCARDVSAGPLVPGTTATLPAEGVNPVFGQVTGWEDFDNMSIIKTAMSADDPDHPEFASVPSYPIMMEDAVADGKTYLGYMLVQPDRATPVEIHTDAGIYSLEIPAVAYWTDAEGNKSEADILKPGFIYDIYININTDGRLDVILGSEDFEKFRDLAPYNPSIADYEYANCYAVTPDKMYVDDAGTEPYNGFYFPAKPGRGGKGLVYSGLYPDGAEFKPVYASVVWQDNPYLVTSVELVHDYVRFVLHGDCYKEGNRLSGNAVIAVHDSAGKVLWSWHIWVVDGLKDITYPLLRFRDLEELVNFRHITEVNNIGVSELGNVTMMNMNLGATKPSWTGPGDVLETYGLYYQWGRKDPSPGPSSYNYSQGDMSTAPYYLGDQKEESGVEKISSGSSVELGARKPLAIIDSPNNETYQNDWLYSSIDQLWGYWPDGKMVLKKTVYDPCPYGYRVPDDELYALFYYCEYLSDGSSVKAAGDPSGGELGVVVSLEEDGTAVKNYFPYSGWKGHDRGRTDKTHAWYNVGNLGDYQDARVCKNSDTYRDHRGRSLLIKPSMFVGGKYVVQDVEPAYTRSLTTDYANRTSASPVRCIRYGREP